MRAALGYFLLLSLVFFAPALFSERVLLPLDALFLYPPWRGQAGEFGIALPNNHLITDTILQNYSWKALAAQAYASGQFPLWNPYILSGQPFLAAGQNGSLYPPGVLFYLLPRGQAYGWFAALHLALGGVLTYWLTRVLGGSRFGGLIAGTTFAFCGYLVVSVLWPMVVSTAAWLPGLLAVIELLARRVTVAGRKAGGRRLLPLVLGGAGLVTLQFLAGHLEMSLYLLATAGLFAALRVLALASRRVGAVRRPSAALRRVFLSGFLLLGMVALGTLGAGVQLVPFAEAIAANVRGGQVTYDDVRGYALPRQQLAAFVAPDFFGNPSHHALFDLWDGRARAVDRPLAEEPEQRLGTEWGSKNYVEGTAYLGILPLLLALVVLAARRDAVTWTLAAIAGLSLLLAFGTPLYSLLFHGLPGVNQLHTPFRWVYPYSLCLAVLAGLGASACDRAPAVCRAGARVGTIGAVLGAVSLLALLYGWLSRDSLVDLAERALRGSSSLRLTFPDARALYSYEWASLAAPALLLLASGLVVLALARGVLGAKLLAVGLLVGDLFSFGVGFNTITSPAPLEFVPPEIEAIKADTSLFRIATLGDDDTLPVNTGMLFGLQDIRGYDTIILRDYVEYLELIEPQRGLLFSKVNKLFDPRSLDSPLLDLLNVKYVLTTLQLDRPGWQLLRDGSVRVYQNTRVMPRAFLVEQAVLAADAGDALRLLGQPGFNPRQQVVLEDASGLPGPPAGRQTGLGFEGPVGPPTTFVSYEPNRVQLEALTLRPTYLVLADMNLAGWTVKVDGVGQRLLRANRIFRAVQLAPGAHTVTFEYRPLSFRLGGLLSLLAVAIGAFSLGVAWYGRLGLGASQASGPIGRLARNSLFPLATGFLNRGLDFLFALVYIRVLGPAGVGAYTFAVVVVGYFDILTNFGLGTLLTREVARDVEQSDRYLTNTLASRLVLALLAVLAALALAGPLAAPLQIGPEVGLAIVLLTLGLVPGAVAASASSVFMARERMDLPAAVTVFSTLLKIGLGTGVLLLGWGIVGLALVSVVVNMANAVVLGCLVVSLLGRPRWSFDRVFAWGLLGLAWPLMLNDFLNNLFFRIDALLLKPLAGDTDLGYYSTAYKFLDGLQIIPSAFVLAVFPLLSRLAGIDRQALARATTLGLRLLLALALPISVGTTLLAEPIIGLLAGPAYLPQSALALQLLIWFLPFSFVNGLIQYVLIALNRQRWITLSFVVGAFANVALNLWAIPIYGYLGAAVVTVFSELVLLAPFWYVVRKEVGAISLPALVWRPALAAALMGLVVYGLRGVNPWLAIPVGAVSYAVALVAVGGASRSELGALRG